jgi:predicted nucleic acid-binding protein
MYLLDTSVLTRLRVPEILNQLRTFSEHGLSRTTLTDLEICYSASNGEEWNTLKSALKAFKRIDIEPHHFNRAGQVQERLAASGLKGRKVPDLLIAAAAEAHSLILIHYDADFDHISAITGQPSEWILPRGAVN